MHVARWAGESLRFGVAQGLLQRRNLFAGEFGQPGEVKKEWQFILTAGINILGFMQGFARREEEIGLVEGDDSHVAIPKDLLVPVYVKVFGVHGVENGLEEVGCVLGGTVLQPLLCALVGGHPSSLGSRMDWRRLAAYLVARFFNLFCALLWGVIQAALPELGSVCLSLCWVCHAIMRRFASAAGWGLRMRWQAEALRPYTLMLGLPCDHASFCFCCWLGAQDEMAGGGPAAIHDHICYRLLDAKLLDEVLGFGLNFFPSGIKVEVLARERIGDRVAALGRISDFNSS
eukprot:s988_g2.t1